MILADGNRASAGELIITRSNDRRLRTSASDWVKNGDRWTVSSVDRDGGLRVQAPPERPHRPPARQLRTESVELGYATTIHTAQGITADTMHGLITGTESRQQLYTMCTRGRLSNHIYLQLVGDGDPHTLIRPDSVRPATATELLEHILARDDTPRSASTLLREQQDPAVRLGDAIERYTDALHVAAEHVVGKGAAQALEGFANRLVPGLTDEPAWPTLRAHLLLLAADGADPHERLRTHARPRRSAVPMIEPPCWTGAWTTPAHAVVEMVLCRGCPEFRTASPPIPHGGRIWMPDHAWLLSSPTRSASPPKVKLAGRPAPCCRAGRAHRRRAGMARRHPGRPQRPATNRATPTRPCRAISGNSNSTSDSPLRLPTSLAMAAIARHGSPKCDRRSIPAGADRKIEQPHPGRFRRQPARAVGGRRRTPTRRPPRRSPLVAHP